MVKVNMEKAEIEVEQIRVTHGGVLLCQHVVDFAQDPGVEIHGCFEWDNTEAGHQYRLWQARKLIQVFVRVEENTKKPYPVYVSLKDDRAGEGGGYRATVDVLSDDEMRDKFLMQALQELNRIRVKYNALKKLAGVFAAIDAVGVT